MRCRLCAAQCGIDCRTLFENGTSTNLNKLITRYLCIQIKHNDTFSTKICVGCVNNLESFHDYCGLVEGKQKLINEEILAMVTVKNEPPDDETFKERTDIFMVQFPNQEALSERPKQSELFQKKPANLCTKNVKIERVSKSSEFHQAQNLMPSGNEVFIKSEMLSDDEEMESTEYIISNVDDLKTEAMDNTEYVISNEADLKNADKKQSYQEHSNNCFNCRICGNVAPSFEDAKAHYNIQHNIALKDVYIICCGLRFYTQKPYDDHRKSPPCRFRCDICNKQLLCAKTLHFHKMAKHTDRQEYKYSCQICGERFMFLCALKEHVPTHRDKKPFKCDICGNSYANLSYLRSHKNRHAANIFKMKKVLDCEHCRQEFSCEENFQAHLLINDNNDCLKNKAKSIEREVTFSYKLDNKCCLCGKAFSKKNVLQKHLDVHFKRLSKKKLPAIFPTLKKLNTDAEENILDSSNSEFLSSIK